ncbi:MAG: RdgB/HAM1 family non-canonical purine NTP pyrophosphatase [Lachnospiraceae bacterium]
MLYNKIIFATGNEGKMKEVRAILADTGMEVLSMKEAQISVDVDENGKTFAENAVIKATAIAKYAKDAIVLSDDSGLVVDGLNGEPGIYSARYMGEDTSYRIKNANIMKRLDDLAKSSKAERSASFVCAIAAVLPDGRVFTTLGEVLGYIGHEELGEGGFGYDPIFMVAEFDQSSAQLSPEVKNAISHRGKALVEMKKLLMSQIG